MLAGNGDRATDRSTVGSLLPIWRERMKTASSVLKAEAIVAAPDSHEAPPLTPGAAKSNDPTLPRSEGWLRSA